LPFSDEEKKRTRKGTYTGITKENFSAVNVVSIKGDHADRSLLERGCEAWYKEGRQNCKKAREKPDGQMPQGGVYPIAGKDSLYDRKPSLAYGGQRGKSFL